MDTKTIITIVHFVGAFFMGYVANRLFRERGLVDTMLGAFMLGLVWSIFMFVLKYEAKVL